MDAAASLRDVRLFIATPAYGGLVTVHYLQSLLAAKARLERLGVTVAVYTIANESLITRARNACVAHFLAARTEGRPFTHLAFIDADLAFPDWALERLLRFGAPVSAAAYPLKGTSGAHALRVPVPAAVAEDFISAHDVGTGFLCLQRPAVEALVAAHPERRYENDVAGYDVPGPGYELDALAFHALFEPAIDPDTRVYLSEDYAFCALWRALGGAIWVDLRARLSHVGTHAYPGDVAGWLQARGVIQRT